MNHGMTPQKATAALKRLMARSPSASFMGSNGYRGASRQSARHRLRRSDKEMYLGSDALALAPLTNRISYLEEGDWAELTPGKAVVHDENGKVVERNHQTALRRDDRQRAIPPFYAEGNLRTTAVVGDTLERALATVANDLALPRLPFD